jgi:hypothetical protein
VAGRPTSYAGIHSIISWDQRQDDADALSANWIFFAYFLYILSDRMMLMCFVRRASLTKFRYLRIFYKFCQRPYLVGKKLAKVTFPTPVALVSKKTHVARFVCLW